MRRLQVLGNFTDVLPGVAEVGQVGALRMIAVLVSRPFHGVGDSLPVVRVGAAPHVVASVRLVARVGDAVLLSLNAVGRLVPANIFRTITFLLQTSYCTLSIGELYRYFNFSRNI